MAYKELNSANLENRVRALMKVARTGDGIAARRSAERIFEMAKDDTRVLDFIFDFDSRLELLERLVRGESVLIGPGSKAGKKLTEDTSVNGYVEDMVKSILLELGIGSYYEIGKFKSGANGKQYTYLPDFIANLIVDGKVVIIEPHSSFDRHDVNKFVEFRREHGDSFHMIMISTMSPQLLLHRHNVTFRDMADGYWHIDTPVGGRSKRISEMSRSRNRIRSHLVDLRNGIC